MHTKGLLLGALAVVFVGSAGTVAPVGAQQETRCTIEMPAIAVEPGLSTEPNSGVFYTEGKTGTIDCGERKGTIGIVRGRYGTADPDSCQDGGEFWGVFSYTFGNETIDETFTGQFGTNTQGAHPGRVEGERISGTYTFTGTEGNCVTAPITRGDASMVVTYRG